MISRCLQVMKPWVKSMIWLRKLKTTLPSLKPPVEKVLKSGIVYEIQCPCCAACYVGQTGRHLQTRLREHLLRSGPMKTHLSQCSTSITEEHVRILHTTTRGENHLLTLETLHIRERKPSINTKDEYRSRELIIKLYPIIKWPLNNLLY